MDVYAGINLANGENGYSLADTYYVLDKDMKKQLAYKAGDKTYLTTAGMIMYTRMEKLYLRQPERKFPV